MRAAKAAFYTALAGMAVTAVFMVAAETPPRIAWPVLTIEGLAIFAYSVALDRAERRRR